MRMPIRPRTIRMRLTLVYASLFLASGIVLLAVALFLVFREPILVTFKVDPPAPPAGAAILLPGVKSFQPATADVQPTWHTLRAMFAQSMSGLAAMTVLSAGLGWIVAGRVLRPLESAFAAQRRFVANASHELRTPLTMMRTSLDVAVGKPAPVPAEVTVLAGKLREGLDASDRLLEGLLLLARVQYTATADPEHVPVSDLAQAALTKRSDALADMRLTAETAISPAQAHGNRMLIGSLVENLVDNAVRHNEPGGWLRVATRTRDGRACLVVENGGEVLEQSSVDLLGQPFQRLGAARTSRTGTGLGLSIVAAITDAHGGTLALRARPDGGLRVEVKL